MVVGIAITIARASAQLEVVEHDGIDLCSGEGAAGGIGGGLAVWVDVGRGANYGAVHTEGEGGALGLAGAASVTGDEAGEGSRTGWVLLETIGQIEGRGLLDGIGVGPRRGRCHDPAQTANRNGLAVAALRGAGAAMHDGDPFGARAGAGGDL